MLKVVGSRDIARESLMMGAAALVPQEGFEPPTPSLRNENSNSFSVLRFNRGVHGSTRPDVIETALARDTALNFREIGKGGVNWHALRKL